MTAGKTTILFYSTSPGDFGELFDILRRTGFEYHVAGDLDSANEISSKYLIDVGVCDLRSKGANARTCAANILKSPAFSLCPLLLIGDRECDADTFGNLAPGEYSFLFSDTPKASALYARISTIVRLLHLRTEKAGFEGSLSAQNVQLDDLRRRFQHELKEAVNIQKSLLPSTLPQVRFAEFAASCIRAADVGGDFYDIWRISKHEIGMFVGDVSGAGLSAAFVAAMCNMALGFSASGSPELMLESMNQSLFDFLPKERFIRASIAVFNGESGDLMLASAGGLPAIVFRRKSKSAEILPIEGPALGAETEPNYVLLRSRMSPGDELFLSSAGLSDTLDMNGNPLGISGLAEIVERAAREDSPEAAIHTVFSEQRAFSSGRIIRDDSTAIALFFTGSGEPDTEGAKE